MSTRPTGHPPKVSVLMTVYNAAPYLRTALDSIVEQTLSDWELVIVENGSSDDSSRILASYTDERIKVSWLDKNIGRTQALRYAFCRARAEYVAVLDADDVSDPERLAKQVAHLDNHPRVVLVGTWARLLNEDGRLLEGRDWTPTTNAGELYERLAWANPFVHSSTMYRRTEAQEVGGYPENLLHSQDGGLWVRLALRGELAMIPECLCQYRVLRNGMTQTGAHRALVAFDRLSLLRYSRDQLQLTKESLRHNSDETFVTEVKYGLAQIQAASFFSGLFTLSKAVARNPKSLLRNRIVNRKHRTR